MTTPRSQRAPPAPPSDLRVSQPQRGTMNVVTEIDSVEPVQPVEITSLRGDAGVRETPSRRALGVSALGLVASAVAIFAAVNATDVRVGPGRVIVALLVIAWAVSAVFVARLRPQEPLSWIMVAGATVGAVAAVSASELDPAASSNDTASAALALSLSLLIAIGLHLSLGLARGTLEHRLRRGVVGAGYVAALP